MGFSPSLGALVLYCVVGGGLEQWVWQYDRFVRKERRPYQGKGLALLRPEGKEPTPLQLSEDSRDDILDVCVLGDDVYGVCWDGAVLRLGGESWSPVADALPGMGDVLGDHMALVAPDHQNGRLVAIATKGQGYHFIPEEGWEQGPRTGPLGYGLTWNPLTRRPEVLRGGGRVGWAEPEPWGDESIPAKPSPSGRWRHLPFAVDEATGEWALLEEHRLLRRVPGGEWREYPLPLALPDTPEMVSVGGSLMALEVKSAGDLRLVGDRWVENDAPISGFYLHAAAEDGTVTFDERGALSLTVDGRTEEIVPACDALSGMDGELALICDRDRVVLWVSHKRQTWIARNRSWSKVKGDGPPRGTGVFCSTPAGLYYVDEQDRTFLLKSSDSWERLAALGSDIRLLFCRPTAPALWAVTPEAVAIWRQGAFHAVAALPGETVEAVRARYGQSSIWYDPKGDRLLLNLSGGVWELPLPDERGGFPTSDSLHVLPRPSKEAETLDNRSCYILEASISPGGARQGLVFAFPDLDSIEDLVERLFLADSAEARMQRDLLAMGGMLTLWVVQEGLLADGIDLRPYMDLGRLTIDRDAVTAAAPAIRGNPMDEEGVRVQIKDFAPEFSYLHDGDLLEYGVNDLEGGGIPWPHP